MIELLRNRAALLLATTAASLWALSLVLAGLADATISSSGAATYNNLFIASAWLGFGAALSLLGATSYVTWNALVRRQFSVSWEIGATTLATLIFAIGLLVEAVSAPVPSDAGFVVSAVGLGGWAVVLVVKAARRSMEEQQDPAVARQAGFLLGGAGALVIVSVALGLPSPPITDSTLAVTGATIYAVGFASLATVLWGARARGLINPRQVAAVISALGILVVASLVEAISDGVVYGPPPISVTSLRLLSIGAFVEAVGFGVLAWAAFNHIARAPVTAGAPGWSLAPPYPSETPPPPPPTAQWSATLPVPPSWQPDPSGRHEFRWWDGVRWSEHVSDAGRSSTDPPG